MDSKNKLKKSIINRQKNVNKHFSLYKNITTIKLNEATFFKDMFFL